MEKSKSTGFDLFKEISRNLKIKCFGPSKNVSMDIPSLNDLLTVYKKSSCYVNTSSWKPCPIAMLEAMSVGCPIVTTSSGVIPKIINNANNGFISNDPKEILHNIDILMKNKTLAKEVGSSGRQTVIRDFNELDFIKRWKDILFTVAGQPNKIITG
jgi:glycosyltransferase involved in cell wall biosynthesis